MTTHPEPHDEPLAPVVRQMLAATNAEDRESFIDAFAADAVVDDFGRRFVGHEQIGRWSDAENIGTHNRIAVTGVRTDGPAVVLDIDVRGAGYNGPGTFAITSDGGLISSMVIRGYYRPRLPQLHELPATHPARRPGPPGTSGEDALPMPRSEEPRRAAGSTYCLHT